MLEQSNLDFLFLQETFLSDNVLDTEVDPPKYHMYRLDRDVNVCKSFGGGLVTYYGSQYKVEQLPNWSVSLPDIEIG